MPPEFSSGRLVGWIEGVKAFGFCGFKQGRRGRNKNYLGAVEHVAGDHCRGELKRFRPAKAGAIEELARSLKHGGIEGLLDHAGRFDAEGIERGSGVLRSDFPGSLAAADGRVHLKGRGGGDELSVVLNGLHEADECIGSLPSHKKPGEGRGLEEITGHAFPRSS